MPIADPRNRAISETRKAMLHCGLRVRWKVASDLRFRAAISEPKTPSFCGISGDLAQSTRKSLAIAIVRFWCAKKGNLQGAVLEGLVTPPTHTQAERQECPLEMLRENWSACFCVSSYFFSELVLGPPHTISRKSEVSSRTSLSYQSASPRMVLRRRRKCSSGCHTSLGYVNSGLHMVLGELCGDQIPLPPFQPQSTSLMSSGLFHLNLSLTSFNKVTSF